MPDLPGAINPSTMEQKLFVLDERVLKPRFLGRHIVQVPMGQRWLIYEDGVLVKQHEPGRHRWWGGFFHEWRAQAINTRIELLNQEALGRVKGPHVPQDAGGSSSVNLACEVKVSFRLSIQIKDTETFLQYREPVTVFRAALRDLVVEFIGQLPYDQFGGWATALRNQIRNALLGDRYNAEQRVGLNIVEIFVVGFEPNTTHDRQVFAMFQLIERGKRELVEAVSNRKSDIEAAHSFADQGAILNIAPSILKLQDSPIGQTLIEQDSNLRELIIASGLNPGVNVQPLYENSAQISNPSNMYLNAPSPAQPQIGQASGPLSQQARPTFGAGQEITGSLAPSGNLRPNSGFSHSVPTSPLAGVSGELPIDKIRQNLELAELENAGFTPAGRGQFVAATNEWTVMASRRRPNGILTVFFICPAGYPNNAPRVQIKTSAGGGLTTVEPNSVRGWQAHRFLADVAREILDTTL